ncbi:MAG: DUF861 domain-containing protein [Archangiaceae bacterium]|nr:DUF861 domain-containing protein [Archangiaceae bacterium]
MRKSHFAWGVLVGVCGFEALHLAGRAAYYVGWVHPQLPPTAERREAPLQPLEVNASWILEGQPTFSSHAYATSHDGSSTSGIWECVGPGRFRWKFGIDESVYVLEGLVHVEYDGKVHTLKQGDTAFFPAGAEAVWTVPERVKKSFTLSEPGRITRLLRRLL